MADKKAVSVRLADLWKNGRAEPPRSRGMSFTRWLLVISWPRLLIMAGAVYVLLVALFAGGYLAGGGVTARPGYFGDAFLFSVQVFVRVNLGFRMPESGLLQLLVICELLMGWLVFIVFLALGAARFMQVHLRGFEMYGLSRQERPGSGERCLDQSTDQSLAGELRSQQAPDRRSN